MKMRMKRQSKVQQILIKSNKNFRQEDDEEFQTENAQAKRLADFISAKDTIGKYKIKKVIGAGNPSNI